MQSESIEHPYLDLDISNEDISISLENMPYDLFYRQRAIRRVPQLLSPVINDINDALLPKFSIYHYNPDNISLFGPLENNPWYRNDASYRFIKHITEFAVSPQGPIQRKPSNVSQYVQAYRKRHRSLRLLRDFFGVNRQANMIMVINYCLLNQLWKYRSHRFINYYRFINMYSTIIYTMNSLANQSDRQQFFEIRLPKLIPTRSMYRVLANDYPKGLSTKFISNLQNDDDWLMFHLWLWLSPNKQYSIFNKINPNNLNKINIMLSESGKYALLNLGKLDEWRSTNDEIDYEIDDTDDVGVIGQSEEVDTSKTVRISVMFYRLLETMLGLRTGSGVTVLETPIYTEAELNASEEPEDEETITDDGKIIPAKQQETIIGQSVADKTVPTEDITTGVTDVATKPKVQEVKVSDNKPTNQSKPSIVTELPDIEESNQPEPIQEPIAGKPEVEIPTGKPTAVGTVVNDEPPEALIQLSSEHVLQQDLTTKGVYDDAKRLLDAGMLTAKQYKRVLAISESYKTIPNPFNPNETIEEAIKSDTKSIVLNNKTKIPDNPWVIDKSMLEATPEAVTKQYVKEVLPKNIMQSVMAIQKSGVLVKDVQKEELVDAANRVDILKVKVQPIDGSESTVTIKIPQIDVNKGNGVMTLAGVNYVMLNQRKDLPIRKVNPTTVKLTTYYGKLFVNKSERKVFNLEKYLITNLQSLMIDNKIINATYGNVFDKSIDTHPIYSYISKRFNNFVYQQNNDTSYRCSFKYKDRASFFNMTEDTITKLEETINGTLFAVSMDDKTKCFISRTDGTVHFLSDTIIEPLLIESFFNFESPTPIEMTEIEIFSKTVPLVILLGYYIGLNNLCRLLGVKPRKLYRGQTANLTPNEYTIKFADETWIFDKNHYNATLILNGFNLYKRYITEYSVHQFDKPDVYTTILRDAGVSYRVEDEFKLMERLFIDDISKSLLQQLNEPTEFIPLLIRASELLTDMRSREEINMDDMIIAGYQRIAGHVYSELVRTVRDTNNKLAAARKRFEIPPYKILQAIQKDPSVVLVDDINPIHNLKEHENVTFTGEGGRGKRSMVAHTREYDPSDLGVISEATVDNANVGVTTFLTPNNTIDTVYGTSKRLDLNTAGSANIFSTPALLGPCSDTDDRYIKDPGRLHY